MPGLRELQHDFQRFMLKDDSAVTTQISNVPPLTVAERLDLYAESYHIRLFDVLTLDYPVLCALMGDETFTDFFREYVDAIPSRYRSIRWFGENVLVFLKEYLQKNTCQYEKSLLLEIAEFEWSLIELFDARNLEVITVPDMLQVKPDDWPILSFKLNANSKKLTVNWNVLEIWHAIKDNENFTATPIREDILIWRQDFEVQFRSLTSDESFMLDQMRAGKNFAELCEALCDFVSADDAALQAATLLKKFIMDELISELQFDAR